MLQGFSLWPDPLGFGAIDDEAVVEQFGDIARQEYLAVGIRTALHPMADLATEPRWGRMNGTFGEDAELVTPLTAAYIRGFQGEGVGPNGISCMVKHFPGGGPQKDGLDAHFDYGKDQAYLDFKEPEKSRILGILNRVPAIVDIYLERAAVIPEIAAASAALLATFSVADSAVLDVVWGNFKPTGKLPIEMPSSMAAVRAQKEDLPYDSANPLFPFGHGLTYE